MCTRLRLSTSTRPSGHAIVPRTCYDNTADHPGRQRRYPSDMTDAEWVVVRPLLPTPSWLEG